MRLRAGVIGAGVMGGHHARNLATLPELRLVAVADPAVERAGALAEELGAAAFARPLDLLGRVDLVVVASPARAHAELAHAFLDAGVHALVEKPLATSVQEGRALVELAAARGVVLQGGHLLRYHGAVRALRARQPAPRELVARRVVRGGRVADVGVVLDLMVHDLDLALLFFGEEPAEVRARAAGADPEAHAEAELRFPSGGRALLTASRLAARPERSLELAGPAGAERLDFADYPHENPLLAQLRHFVERVGGAPALHPPEEDLRALALALRVQAALAREAADLPAGR